MDLSGLKVAVIANDGFEEAELLKPVEALKEAGATTVIVSKKSGSIQGYKHFEKGQQVQVDQVLDSVDAEDFDAALLPGGTMNADSLRREASLQDFLAALDADDKPIAAICHAPWELISAELVEGRRMTSYHTIQDDLRNAGAAWVDEEVVVDGNWVTSRQPDDIPAFNKAMLDVFAKAREDAAGDVQSDETGEARV